MSDGRTMRRWYCEQHVVRQLPLLFRLWARYLRFGPKRSGGGTAGGSLIFNMLKRRRADPSIAFYWTIKRPNSNSKLTIDLYDFECFNHTLDLWLYGDRIGQVIRWILRGGGTFIDGGANYGVYTLSAVLDRSRAIRVLAVEPQRKVAEALRRTVRYSGLDNVIVYEVALGEAAGAGCLYAPETSSGTASMVRKNVDPAWPLIELRVRIETLDSIAKSTGDSVTLVKLDIQGSELNALRGATTLLHKNGPYVLLEVEPTLHPDPQEQERVFTLLQAAGYERFFDLSTMLEWNPRLQAIKSDVIAVPPHYEIDFEKYRRNVERSPGVSG